MKDKRKIKDFELCSGKKSQLVLNPASATKEEMQAERLAFFIYISHPDLLPD